eukprot:339352-Chlamydomonas_euryale.AAC.1
MERDRAYYKLVSLQLDVRAITVWVAHMHVCMRDSRGCQRPLPSRRSTHACARQQRMPASPAWVVRLAAFRGLPVVVARRLLTIFGPCSSPARADLVPPEDGRWASLASEAEGLAN